MKITKIFIFLIIVSWGNNIFCQVNLNNALEVSFAYGHANDLTSLGTYALSSPTGNPTDAITVDKKSHIIAKNIGLSYTYYVNNKNGIKLQFGIIQTGFEYSGRFQVSRLQARGSYRLVLYEWGVSYIRRFPISNFATLMVEPGLRYYSFRDSPRSNQFRISRRDAFSGLCFVGIELPLIGNNLFLNAGIQAKLPLQKYNNKFNYNSQPDYYPYFVGAKIGISVQFNWSSLNLEKIF